MRWLKVLVVVMGVLIVAGTVALAVLLVQRSGGGGAARVGAVALGLGEGERITGLAGAGDRFAVRVEGAGGGSRVLLLDQRGRVVGEVRER